MKLTWFMIALVILQCACMVQNTIAADADTAAAETPAAAASDTAGANAADASTAAPDAAPNIDETTKAEEATTAAASDGGGADAKPAEPETAVGESTDNTAGAVAAEPADSEAPDSPRRRAILHRRWRRKHPRRRGGVLGDLVELFREARREKRKWDPKRGRWSGNWEFDSGKRRRHDDSSSSESDEWRPSARGSTSFSFGKSRRSRDYDRDYSDDYDYDVPRRGSRKRSYGPRPGLRSLSRAKIATRSASPAAAGGSGLQTRSAAQGTTSKKASAAKKN